MPGWRGRLERPSVPGADLRRPGAQVDVKPASHNLGARHEVSERARPDAPGKGVVRGRPLRTVVEVSGENEEKQPGDRKNQDGRNVNRKDGAPRPGSSGGGGGGRDGYGRGAADEPFNPDPRWVEQGLNQLEQLANGELPPALKDTLKIFKPEVRREIRTGIARDPQLLARLDEVNWFLRQDPDHVQLVWAIDALHSDAQRTLLARQEPLTPVLHNLAGLQTSEIALLKKFDANVQEQFLKHHDQMIVKLRELDAHRGSDLFLKLKPGTQLALLNLGDRGWGEARLLERGFYLLEQLMSKDLDPSEKFYFGYREQFLRLPDHIQEFLLGRFDTEKRMEASMIIICHCSAPGLAAYERLNEFLQMDIARNLVSSLSEIVLRAREKFHVISLLSRSDIHALNQLPEQLGRDALDRMASAASEGKSARKIKRILREYTGQTGRNKDL